MMQISQGTRDIHCLGRQRRVRESWAGIAAYSQSLAENERRLWGHPLAGPSSRHRLSHGEELSFSSPVDSSPSTFDRLNYAPLFSVGRCRTFGPHQSPIRIKALGRFLKKRISSRPWQRCCPRKLLGYGVIRHNSHYNLSASLRLPGR